MKGKNEAEKINKHLSDLVNNINEYCERLNEVLDVIWLDNDYGTKQPHRFYYLMFFKLRALLASTTFHVLNLYIKREFTIALNLILRTAMLDVISLYYVMDATEDDEEQQERINKINADHLIKTFPDFDKEGKKQIIKDFPELFDVNGVLQYNKHLYLKDMERGIQKFPTLIKEFKELKFIYNLFSKFEHNGAFTFDLLHNPYSDEGFEKSKDMTIRAIRCLALGLKMVRTNWVNDNHALHDDLENCVTKFFKT